MRGGGCGCCGWVRGSAASHRARCSKEGICAKAASLRRPCNFKSTFFRALLISYMVIQSASNSNVWSVAHIWHSVRDSGESLGVLRCHSLSSNTYSSPVCCVLQGCIYNREAKSCGISWVLIIRVVAQRGRCFLHPANRWSTATAFPPSTSPALCCSRLTSWCMFSSFLLSCLSPLWISLPSSSFWVLVPLLSPFSSVKKRISLLILFIYCVQKWRT